MQRETGTQKIGIETNIITFLETREKASLILDPKKVCLCELKTRHDRHIRFHWVQKLPPSDTRLRLTAAIRLVFCGITARLVIARLTIVIVITAAIIRVAVVAAVCTNAILTLPLTLCGRSRLSARIIRI